MMCEFINKLLNISLPVILLTAGALHGQEIEISATVNAQQVAIDQAFTYTIELSGSKANSVKEDPVLPNMEEFATYMGSSGTSQNIQFINGRMSVSKSYSFTYMATKVGTFEIGPAEISYNGNKISSNKLTIEIVAGGAGQRGSSPRSRPDASAQGTSDLKDNLLLRVFIDKSRVYVNEPVILSYKIYTAVTVTSYGISKQPDMEGFWVEEFELPNPPPTKREMYNGKEYIVAEIRKLALFPTDAGKKTVGSMQIQCDVRVQNQRRSIFDSFFDDPFFGRSIKADVFSSPVNIEVLPLPETGRPASFSGAVGDYTMAAAVDKQTVETNDAIALKLTLKGTGNIKMLPEPEVNIPPDFEKYDPKISRSIERTGNRIAGSKVMEYVLIPRFPGIQRIRPIEFNFFNPRTSSYETIRTSELVIDVLQGDDEMSVAGAGLSKEEVKLLGQDIRFIQRNIPKLRRQGHFFYQSPFFIIGLLLPLVLMIAAILQRRHMDKMYENQAYARNRKANQLARKRLRRARSLLQEDTQKEFYAETSRALIGFLADKLNLSAAGIITDELEAMMREKGIDQETVASFMDCINRCDYQRFAPSDSTTEEMNQLYEQAQMVISKIERSIK
ncbi:protein BatD [candidate division KSB1 bacterium]|nr:protein BatD [candidate division KSB1 bacterium]